MIYVYLIGNKELSYYKIGMSTNIEKRLHDIRHNVPFVVKLFHREPCRSRKYAFQLEQRLHRLYHPRRLENEWFSDISAEQFHMDCAKSRIGL